MVIQSIMLVVLGLFVATLGFMVVVPVIWRRATRMAVDRVVATLPMSIEQIEAERDQLRAEFAIGQRKLEKRLETLSTASQSYEIEIGRRDALISALQVEVFSVRNQLDEELKANQILKETVAQRLPELEKLRDRASMMIDSREREIERLTSVVLHHEDALAAQLATEKIRQAEIERLRLALASTRGGQAVLDAPAPSERAELELARLKQDLDRVRAENRDLVIEIERLRTRLETGFGDRGGLSYAPTVSASQLESLREEMRALAAQLMAPQPSAGRLTDRGRMPERAPQPQAPREPEAPRAPQHADVLDLTPAMARPDTGQATSAQKPAGPGKPQKTKPDPAIPAMQAIAPTAKGSSKAGEPAERSAMDPVLRANGLPKEPEAAPSPPKTADKPRASAPAKPGTLRDRIIGLAQSARKASGGPKPIAKTESTGLDLAAEQISQPADPARSAKASKAEKAKAPASNGGRSEHDPADQPEADETNGIPSKGRGLLDRIRAADGGSRS